MESNRSKERLLPYNRKQFILDSLKITSGALVIPAAGFSNPLSGMLFPPSYTVKDIMDIILKEVPGAPFKETVDTLKAGNAEQKVTGVVTTMFATIELIRKAIKLNANFIIAHEPTFYNHTDDRNWVKNNSVVQQKLELLNNHNITVWRFHDYCHSLKPDAISYGVAKLANWLPYFKSGETTLTIPALKLEDLVAHLKKSLGISHVKVIGDLNQSCSKISLLPGAWGGQMHVSTVEQQKPDVLVVGEVQEWETAEYIRDARALGAKTALIVLGHCVSEEPGMQWLPEWLAPKLPGLSVTHIPSGDPFLWK